MKNKEIETRFIKIESDIKLIKYIGWYLTAAITAHLGLSIPAISG